MASYKERVGQDLDRWIEAGYVPAASRGAMLDAIPDGRRLDAATTLVWVGVVLAGVAVIAFIAANWDAIPRLARFGVLLALYASAAGGAAGASRGARPNAANGLLTFAAIVFAATIGLTGQIFDFTGDPRTALYLAGAASAALALAAGASGPAVAAVFFFGAGDAAVGTFAADDGGFDLPSLLFVAPAAAALAMHWRSRALAHAAGAGLAAVALWLATKIGADAGLRLVFAMALALLAAGARWLRERGEGRAGILYGWLTWAAVAFYISAGFGRGSPLDIAHRLGWLLIGGGLVALGRFDRQAAVATAGVLSLIGGVSALMYDLGLGLLTASAVFFCAAVLAGLIGLALRRRPR